MSRIEEPLTRHDFVKGASLAVILALLGMFFTMPSTTNRKMEKELAVPLEVVDRRYAEKGQVPNIKNKQHRYLYKPTRNKMVYVPFHSGNFRSYSVYSQNKKSKKSQYKNDNEGPKTEKVTLREFFHGLFSGKEKEVKREKTPQEIAIENSDGSAILARIKYPKLFKDSKSKKKDKAKQKSGKSAASSKKSANTSFAKGNVSKSNVSALPIIKAGKTAKNPVKPVQSTSLSLSSFPQVSSALSYPPSKGTRRQSQLSDAWEKCRDSMGVVYNNNNAVSCSYCSVSEGTAVTSILGTFFQPPMISPPNNYTKLGMIDSRSYQAELSPNKPQVNEWLATCAGYENMDYFNYSLVWKTKTEGWFFTYCPADTPAYGGGLVNSFSQIAGTMVGTLPGYPAHNYILNADSSLVYDYVSGKNRSGNNYFDAYNVLIKQMQRDIKSKLCSADTEAISNSRNTWAIATESLGHFYLGESPGRIESILGKPTHESLHRVVGNLNIEKTVYDQYKLEFIFLGGELCCITTWDSSYATPSGICPGANWNSIRTGEELDNPCTGLLPSGNYLVIGKGIELELDSRQNITKMRITPR